MKRNVLIFGSVIGAILSVNTIIMMNRMCNDPDFKSNDVIGYAALVVLFSLIYFGVRNYRKNIGGSITFGRAFKTGAMIALVASTIYTVAGLTYYYAFAPEFIDVYTDYVLRNTPPVELQVKTAEMEAFKEMYKNPLFAILITYFEVLPIGLIVSLVSALLLKKRIEPANPTL